MARKRMFDLEIVDTDLFLEMPQSTQNLYSLKTKKLDN